MEIREFSPEALLGPLNETERKHAPAMLYAAGKEELARHSPRVSVIGSRRATDRGLRGAQFLAELLISIDAVVVSGLARGIDSTAHETALSRGGKTIAVIGTALSDCYPKENRELQERMMQEQLVVSEFPDGSPTSRKNFVLRNRTMALLSNASIIVEAGEKSGTQHQGWEALRLGRVLFLPKPFVEETSFEWPREMVRYGAIPFTKDTLPGLLQELPNGSSSLTCEAPF